MNDLSAIPACARHGSRPTKAPDMNNSFMRHNAPDSV